MPEHVAIDLDGVTVDFHGGIIDAVNRDFDVDIRHEDWTSWGWDGLSEVIGRDWWDWVRDNPHLWAYKMKPVAGALGGLERLRQSGHHLEAVTSKPRWAEWTVWAWVQKYVPAFNSVTIVPHDADKTSYTSARILVDDRDKNVVEWVESDPDRRAVLFHQPWNREFREAGFRPYAGLRGAADWRNVVRVVELEAGVTRGSR